MSVLGFCLFGCVCMCVFVFGLCVFEFLCSFLDTKMCLLKIINFIRYWSDLWWSALCDLRCFNVLSMC